MLNSEDAIANVANCIMMADWRWDDKRKGKTGKQKNKYSYRNQCAIWAIKSYMTRKKNKYSKEPIVDLDVKYQNEDLSLLNLLPNKSKTPIDIAIDKETKKEIHDMAYAIFSEKNTYLSDRQKDCLKLYYIEGMTFAQIGKKYSITREAVRQNIKKAISKIRSLMV
jgi:RNA polymerase sigma factor (sigma-70 family)